MMHRKIELYNNTPPKLSFLSVIPGNHKCFSKKVGPSLCISEKYGVYLYIEFNTNFTFKRL